MRAAVVPDWLAGLMRPKPAPLPWPDMIRAALSTCVPLAAGGPRTGLLLAAGGLLGTLTDRGGQTRSGLGRPRRCWRRRER